MLKKLPKLDFIPVIKLVKKPYEDGVLQIKAVEKGFGRALLP